MNPRGAPHALPVAAICPSTGEVSLWLGPLREEEAPGSPFLIIILSGLIYLITCKAALLTTALTAEGKGVAVIVFRAGAKTEDII